MTTDDIKKFTILAECTEGRYILAETVDPFIIKAAGATLKWHKINPELVCNLSLKEIMIPADENE